MGFKLNLTGEEIKAAQGGAFPPLAEGTYGAVIFEAVQKKSKAGNEMYELNYKITEGVEGIGRKLKSWYVLSGKGAFKLVELGKATGLPYPTKTTPAGEFEFPDADEFLGIEVNIELIQEGYESVEDVEDPDTGEITEEEVTKYRNTVKKVTKYDASKIGGNEAADAGSGLFL